MRDDAAAHDTQNHRVSVAIFPLILTQIDWKTDSPSSSQRDACSALRGLLQDIVCNILAEISRLYLDLSDIVSVVFYPSRSGAALKLNKDNAPAAAGSAYASLDKVPSLCIINARSLIFGLRVCRLVCRPQRIWICFVLGHWTKIISISVKD